MKDMNEKKTSMMSDMILYVDNMKVKFNGFESNLTLVKRAITGPLAIRGSFVPPKI